MKLNKKERFEYFTKNLKNAHNHNLNSAFEVWINFIENDYEIQNFFKFILKEDNTEEYLNDEYIITFVNRISDKFQVFKSTIFKNTLDNVLFNYKVLLQVKLKRENLYDFLTSAGFYLKGDHEIKVRNTLNFFIDPIFNFINLKLIDSDNLLNLLTKYKKKKEWFNRTQFYKKYNDEGREEEFVDLDLREFLFDNGIEYPFSTVKSPSGRADIIANIDSLDPIVIEVKILDKVKNYYKGRIIEGITQAYNYVTDYQKNRGFLIVFNANSNDQKIIFDSDDSYPSKLIIGAISIFVIIININPEGKTASEQGKISSVQISKEEVMNIINEKTA